MKLLSDNNKISKGEAFGYYTQGVHLSPYNKSGRNVCPWAGIRNADRKTIFELFPKVQYYDYTKGFSRMKAFLDGKMPSNYHLTFSRSESNQAHCDIISELGGNVACVFRNQLPERWQGKRVVNGDESDLRFNDPQGCIVGLVEKGRAKKDESGFVLN